MEAIYRQSGDTIDYTPGGNVSAGDVVVLGGSLVGVALEDIAANALGTLKVRGIFDVVQAAVTFTVGQAVYWDDDATCVGGGATGAAVENSALGVFMGYAVAATAATDLTVRVALRSVEASLAESLVLSQLGDVGATAYTAGKILVADGAAYAEVAVSGDGTLSAAGVLAITGFAAMPVIPSATVAAAGTVQADATLIATGFTLVTAADAAKGVKLPAAAAGKICIIKNRDAENAILKIWPNTSDAINAIAADGNFVLAAKTSCILVAYDAVTWYSIPLLGS